MSRHDPTAAGRSQTPADLPDRCHCRHLATFHALRDGQRRACSAYLCDCRAFTPQENTP